ncbi:MAG: integrase [Alphaproteobacteria bacterium CG_4_10_14_0_8_um_filter_53_9]|nr:MAG: integrase [Alphaproteobacteria bacterium CG_4_10_14_0_8_um_filter_53_9]
MATIYKRIKKDGTPYFRVRIRLKGHRSEEGNFDRLTDARNWIQSTEAAIKEGRYFKTAEAQRRTLGEMIDRYVKFEIPKRRSSKAKYEMQALWWKRELGHLVIKDVTPAIIAEARDKLLVSPSERNKSQDKPLDANKTKGPATVVHYMAVLSHAFSIANREWMWAEENPVLKVRKPNLPYGRTRFLSDAERGTLLGVCRASPHPYLYTVVVLALSTGARYSEIMTLRWEDVDLVRGVAKLEKTKNGDKRAIPLTGHALALLQELKRTRQRVDSPYLFARLDGQAPMEIRKVWEDALKRAEIKDFRFHDLRHSAASYLAMNGATLVEIAAVLGHKTLQMVKRYAHLSDSHISGVVGRMNEKIFTNHQGMSA